MRTGCIVQFTHNGKQLCGAKQALRVYCACQHTTISRRPEKI